SSASSAGSWPCRRRQPGRGHHETGRRRVTRGSNLAPGGTKPDLPRSNSSQCRPLSGLAEHDKHVTDQVVVVDSEPHHPWRLRVTPEKVNDDSSFFFSRIAGDVDLISGRIGRVGGGVGLTA